jgi:O-methyltransferase involved in polyketide biosynthesis
VTDAHAYPSCCRQFAAQRVDTSPHKTSSAVTDTPYLALLLNTRPHALIRDNMAIPRSRKAVTMWRPAAIYAEPGSPTARHLSDARKAASRAARARYLLWSSGLSKDVTEGALD